VVARAAAGKHTKKQKHERKRRTKQRRRHKSKSKKIDTMSIVLWTCLALACVLTALLLGVMAALRTLGRLRRHASWFPEDMWGKLDTAWDVGEAGLPSWGVHRLRLSAHTNVWVHEQQDTGKGAGVIVHAHETDAYVALAAQGFRNSPSSVVLSCSRGSIHIHKDNPECTKFRVVPYFDWVGWDGAHTELIAVRTTPRETVDDFSSFAAARRAVWCVHHGGMNDHDAPEHHAYIVHTHHASNTTMLHNHVTLWPLWTDDGEAHGWMAWGAVTDEDAKDYTSKKQPWKKDVDVWTSEQTVWHRLREDGAPWVCASVQWNETDALRHQHAPHATKGKKKSKHLDKKKKHKRSRSKV
jgi:hypothetical protein